MSIVAKGESSATIDRKKWRAAMRILFVAPEFEGNSAINAVPEMRAISAKHTVYSLVGKNVTVNELLEIVDRWKFDVIHFTSHMSERGVEMSNGELLEPADCALAARTAKASVVVFSGCDSGLPANYVVNYGPEYSIFATRKLTSNEFWKFALAFYNAFPNGHADNVLDAYLDASNKDGSIGWTMNPEIAAEAVRLAGLQKQMPPPSTLKKWQIVAFLLLLALSMVLSFVAIAR